MTLKWDVGFTEHFNREYSYYWMKCSVAGSKCTLAIYSRDMKQWRAVFNETKRTKYYSEYDAKIAAARKAKADLRVQVGILQSAIKVLNTWEISQTSSLPAHTPEASA